MRRGNFNGNINQIKYEDDDGKKKSAACAQKRFLSHCVLWRLLSTSFVGLYNCDWPY